MMQIFISYSRRDSELVDHLIKDLEARGIDTWVDRTDLKGGEQFLSAIGKAISECSAFAVVLSPHSVASDNVAREVGVAFEEKRRIVPLLHQAVEIPAASTMKLVLTGLQWIDFANKPYEQALLDLVGALKPNEATPTPPLESASPEIKPAEPVNAPASGTALVTPVEGTPVSIPAETLALSVAGSGLPLINGLTVLFNQIKKFEIVQMTADPNLQVKVEIELMNGKTVMQELSKDVLANGPALNGATELGPFSLDLLKLKKVEFEWQ